MPPRGYGGIERIVDALAREYQRQGHEVGLLALAESECPVPHRFAWPAASVRGVFAGTRNALALAAATRRFAPDVLHSFSRLAYLAAELPSARPKIMSYQRHTGGRLIRWAARAGGRSLQFTGCSVYICEMGRRAGGSWEAIPNFVEIEKLAFAPRVAADAPLVFLSRVESIKGPDLAIAIARAAGRRLIIAGNRAESGPERVFWDREIAPHLGQGGVEYVGEVGDQQKSDLLARAAAMIVPIRWNEPFGIVFAEALAAGAPVITCARGALPEIITPGETGFFISTVEEGVAAVRALASIDRAHCRRTAEARFSLPVCAARYLALYRRLIS